MKYTVGAYTIDPAKPFNTIDQAVGFIQERHPELSRSEIERFINPKIQNNVISNSGGVPETTAESGKATPKADKKRNESNGTGKH